MFLTAGEKIKIILGRKKLTMTDLALKLDISRQNLSNKFSRDNFSEKELIKIAEVLDCTFESNFIMNDTKEKI